MSAGSRGAPRAGAHPVEVRVAGSRDASRAGPCPVEVRVAGVGGVDLAVTARNPAGPATPVLLVHGLASNARLWDGVASVLAGAGHPVAAVDQRGHGRSDKPDAGYDFATLAGDIAAVVDALDWRGRPILAAGQSWGGNVVVELAALCPELLGAIALVDGGTIELRGRFADWPTCEAALTPPDLAGMTLTEWERLLRRRHPDWPDAGIAGTLANVEVLPDATIRPWLGREHHLAILRHLWEHRPSKRFSGLQTPVLLVPAGDPSARPARYDQAKRAEVAAAEAALAVHATRWVDGGHDLHAQQPELVAALLAGAADGSVFETHPFPAR